MTVPGNDPVFMLQNALDNKAMLVQQTVATVRAALAKKADPKVPLPYIPPASKHFKYAVLIGHGYENGEACEIVGCSPRTAERWRQKLCAEARDRYGFNVDYSCIARDIVEAAVRAMNEPRRDPRGQS